MPVTGWAKRENRGWSANLRGLGMPVARNGRTRRIGCCRLNDRQGARTFRAGCVRFGFARSIGTTGAIDIPHRSGTHMLRPEPATHAQSVESTTSPPATKSVVQRWMPASFEIEEI